MGNNDNNRAINFNILLLGVIKIWCDAVESYISQKNRGFDRDIKLSQALESDYNEFIEYSDYFIHDYIKSCYVFNLII